MESTSMRSGQSVSGIISLLFSILSITEFILYLILPRLSLPFLSDSFKASPIPGMAVILITAIGGLISAIAGTHKGSSGRPLCSAGLMLNSIIIISSAGLVITYALLFSIFKYLSF